ITSLVVSPDARTIVSGSTDKTVRLWNLRPQGGQKKSAEKPARGASDKPDELIQAFKGRVVIEEQRLTQVVQEKLRTARDRYAANPNTALQLLWDTLSQIWDHPDLSDRARLELVGQVISARRELAKKAASGEKQ